MKKVRKGFTLVELLIVISILGVLAASMSMSVQDATPKAKASKIISDMRTIGAAFSTYALASMDAETGPNVPYFIRHSADYVFGGKMGQYVVESADNATTIKPTHVKLDNSKVDKPTLAILRDLSPDVGLVDDPEKSGGSVKMRIN